MYNDWLAFFNSSITEINVNNKKEKHKIIVKKEWLDNGSMKLSGNKPSEWSVELQPFIYEDIFTLQHQSNYDKLESLYLITRAFKYKDTKLFEEGEKMYDDSKKKNEDIQNMILKNKNELTNIHEKIFQTKRNIYLENLKKTRPTENIKNLTTKLETFTIDNINITKQIKEQENNYLVQQQNILIKGPVPDPPIIKSLTLKTHKYKLMFEKNIENIKVNSNKNVNENNKDVNENNNNNKGVGGFIKVIKL
jgi:hypothetical protein